MQAVKQPQSRHDARAGAAHIRVTRIPPTTSGPHGPDGTRARRAADARILPVVQRVVGQAAGADVLPDLLFGPIEQRAQFEEAVLGIPLFGRALRARRRMLAAHTRHPGLVTGNGALEGLNLAHFAARQSRRQALLETIYALRAGQALQLLRVRVHEPNAWTVALFKAAEEVVGLFGQAPGVDAEDLDLGQMRGNDVGQHHGLGTQAIGIHHAPMLTHGRGQKLAHARGFLLQVQGEYVSHSMEI